MSKKILIVDDAKVARQLQKRMLAEMGLTDILEASDGTEAVELLKNQKVDLILSDWNMPQMSGLELLKHVRSTENTKTVPFIMITAEGMDSNVVAAVKAGVSGYIKKPFGPGVLKEKITQILKI
jgi:two-component system chemotaxis response regulator CheY